MSSAKTHANAGAGSARPLASGPALLPLISLPDGICRLGLVDAHARRYTCSNGRKRRGTAGHCHAVYHVLLYLEGSACFRWLGAMQPFQPGTVVLTAPGEEHSFHTPAAAPCAYKMVTLLLEPVSQLMQSGGVTDWAGVDPKNWHPPRHQLPSWPELLALLSGHRQIAFSPILELSKDRALVLEERLDSAIAQLLSADVLADYERQWSVMEILRFLVSEHQKRSARPAATGDTRLDSCHQFITEHFRERLSIRQLAQLARLSAPHFQRRFRQAYGLTPMAMQRRLRMTAAKRLLRATNRRIADIAECLGYGDVYHFSALFKREVGMPPGRYRKEGTVT